MKAKRPYGPPMTLGNMRQLGVQRLIASCLNYACRHQGLCLVVSGRHRSAWFRSRVTCAKCGGRPPRCNRCAACRMHPYCFVPTVDSDHSARADSTRCKSAPMDGDGVGLWMSFFFALTLDDGSVGFSTRRDDPSNREFSSIDSDL